MERPPRPSVRAMAAGAARCPARRRSSAGARSRPRAWSLARTARQCRRARLTLRRRVAAPAHGRDEVAGDTDRRDRGRGGAHHLRRGAPPIAPGAPAGQTRVAMENPISAAVRPAARLGGRALDAGLSSRIAGEVVDRLVSSSLLERALDRALAGPLVEALAQDLVRHAVLERAT